MKIPKCPICGGSHYKTFCYRNPRRKSILKQRYKKGVASKNDTLLRNEKSLDRRKLIMELDKYCSWIVRLKASNEFGMINCYTCGKKIPINQAHCCHFISRRFGGTRFDFDNLRAGCENCNVVLRGNLEVYKKKLTKELGEEAIERLEQKKNLKIPTPELETLLKKVRQEYNNLVEQKRTEQKNSFLV